MLDEEFVEKRLNALYAHDPEKTCRVKDVHGELLALGRYANWLYEMKNAADVSRQSGIPAGPRLCFYEDLYAEVHRDDVEVFQEWHELLTQATPLGQMEWAYLDKDGGTIGIQKALAKGDIRMDDEDMVEFKAKYGHLALTGYAATPLGKFEANWLDATGGTANIEAQLQSGRDILLFWGPEVARKYGHLRTRYALNIFEREYYTNDDGTVHIEHDLQQGVYVFAGQPEEVTKKYGHLMSHYVPRQQSQQQ